MTNDRYTEAEITTMMWRMSRQPMSAEQRKFFDAVREAYERKLAELKSAPIPLPAPQPPESPGVTSNTD